MKHNKLWSILSFLLISILLNGIVSCSSEGNSNEEGGNSSEMVNMLKANKWISRDASYGIGNNDHVWVDIESTCLYFTSDNGGVVYWTQKDYDTDLGNSRNYDYEDFTYSISGNKVIISTESSSSELIYTNGYLAFNGGVYEKIAMSSSDYELLRNISPKSGNCGSGLTYIYTPKTKGLQISGNGQMSDYSSSNQPWHNFYIESVIIEDGCTYVGANAFVGKLELGTIQLPNTLTGIGAQAFSGTTITKITIPNNVKTIGTDAFYNCQYLQTVYLSNNLESIGSGAFANCAIKYQNLTLPDNVEEVGDYAFSGWQAGTLTLNNKLKVIGNGAFTGVKGTLTIPNSVESIGAVAFDGTFSKVIIGTGLKTLSRGAFGGSHSSGSMYVNLGVPLDIDGDVMASDNQYKWTLYVPKGSKKAYQANKYWKGFKSIIEDASLSSGNGTPEEGGEDNGEDTPQTNGTINGHEYVDLGLSVKWATCNIGAIKPEENGAYYCWGRTKSSWDTPNLTMDATNICGTSYDVAHTEWGSTWKLPTKEQFQELIDNCTFSVAKQNGVSVIIAKSKKNKQKIIFPLCGYKEGFYERSTTDFKFVNNGKTAYSMIGEVYDKDSYYSAKNHYFACWSNTLEVSCNSYKTLKTMIYSDVFQFTVRPVSK